MSMRLGIKKKGFWPLTVMSTWWYLVLSITFYVMDTIATSVPNAPSPFKTMIWKDRMLDAFSFGQMWFLLLALLIGAGAIANDNRANALLVYLSKPCSKTDYLIGKWVGLFIPISCVYAAPTILFYGYCAMSYRDYGFVSSDPFMLPELLLLAPIAGAFHASLMLGISSLFNQGRTAGAVYAALYFMSSFVTKALGGAYAFSILNEERPNKLLENAFYFSVDGVQIALAKVVLHTNGSSFLLSNGGRNRGFQGPPPIPPAPNGLLFFTIYAAVCAIALWVAWSRIRAVEVVGS